MHGRPCPRPIPTLLLALLIGAAAGCRPGEPEDGAPVPEEEVEVSEVPAAPPSPTPTLEPSPLPEAGGPVPGTGAAPDLPTDRPLRAGFLVVDGVYNTELAAPLDVFHHTQFHTKPGMQVFTVSPDGKPITTFEGLRLTPDHSFANAPALDILVVPSARGSMDTDLENRALIDWVRKTGAGARHVLSLCDGAFVLARAGLLDGIPATTFPEDYDRFAQMFPNVDLRINVSFVDAGKVITSQGGARSYEAAMHLVDELYGQSVAEGVGKGLLVPWPPDPELVTYVVVPDAVEPPEPDAEEPAPASPAAEPSPGRR